VQVSLESLMIVFAVSTRIYMIIQRNAYIPTGKSSSGKPCCSSFRTIVRPACSKAYLQALSDLMNEEQGNQLYASDEEEKNERKRIANLVKLESSSSQTCDPCSPSLSSSGQRFSLTMMSASAVLGEVFSIRARLAVLKNSMRSDVETVGE
jgi:hypothetical protein